MDYFRGYRTLRDDPEWTSKLFKGFLLALCSAFIPLLPSIALQGWGAMVLRRFVNGIDTPLPRLDFDFDYLGKLLNPGFKAFIVRLLWSLPASFLLSGFVMCAYFGFLATVIGGAGQGGDAGGAGALVGAICFVVALLLLYPFFILLTMPATIASMRAEITDDLNEGMKFAEVIAMTRMMAKELFIGGLLIGTVQTLLTLVGLLFCYFPAFGVAWVGVYVHAMFQGEIYKAYLAKGGTPLSKIAPPELPLPTPPQPPAPPLPPQAQAGGW